MPPRPVEDCCEDSRSLDIIMPKSFSTDVSRSSNTLSQYSACRLPCLICMVLHLSGLKLRSHFSLHSSSLFMSHLSTSMSSAVFIVLYILTSSANKLVDDFMLATKSLMYTRKRTGPWGTLLSTGRVSHHQPLMVTLWNLFLRKLFVHSKNFLSITNCF